MPILSKFPTVPFGRATLEDEEERVGGAEEYREGVMRPCDLLVSWCLGVSHWSEPENCSRPASTARHKDTMTAYGHDPVSKISPDVLGLVDHTHPAAQLLEDAVVGDGPREHLYSCAVVGQNTRLQVEIQAPGC